MQLKMLLTCVLGNGCPAAVAASIIAAYCSGDGRNEGIGSLLGRFVGGGATAAEDKNNQSYPLKRLQTFNLRSSPFISYPRRFPDVGGRGAEIGVAVTEAGKFGNVCGIPMFDGVIIVHPIVFGMTNFSGSGVALFGTLSYSKLPSGPFGGFGNATFSGFGIISRGVNFNHSQPVVAGLPRRFAINVTLPRSFFLYLRKLLISVMFTFAIAIATVRN